MKEKSISDVIADKVTDAVYEKIISRANIQLKSERIIKEKKNTMLACIIVAIMAFACDIATVWIAFYLCYENEGTWTVGPVIITSIIIVFVATVFGIHIAVNIKNICNLIE